MNDDNDNHNNNNIEPVIVRAALAAGHDGLAEVSVALRYPNGAERTMSLPCDAVDRALDSMRISTLEQLVGRPWTALVGDHQNDHENDHQ